MTKPPFRSIGLVGFLVAVMLAAQGAVGIAHAAGCTPTTEPFPLCGTTTISGSASGSLRVSLSSTATLSALTGPGGGVQLSGGGRLVAFVLQSSADPHNVLYYSQTTSTFGGDRFDTTRGYIQDLSGNYTLAAGSYVLYVITDGAAATITMNLQGVSGSNSLSVQRATPHTVDAVLTNQAIGGSTVSAQGAKSYAVSGPTAFLARYLNVQQPSQVASAAAACLWDGTPPPEASSQPFCPGATEKAQTNPTLATQPSYHFALLTGPVGSGTYGQGGYAVSASSGGTLSIVGLWLTLTG
jgi:hypothetical protein